MCVGGCESEGGGQGRVGVDRSAYPTRVAYTRTRARARSCTRASAQAHARALRHTRERSGTRALSVYRIEANPPPLPPLRVPEEGPRRPPFSAAVAAMMLMSWPWPSWPSWPSEASLYADTGPPEQVKGDVVFGPGSASPRILICAAFGLNNKRCPPRSKILPGKQPAQKLRMEKSTSLTLRFDTAAPRDQPGRGGSTQHKTHTQTN